MTVAAEVTDRHRFSLAQYLICLKGIVWREALRFIHQRERFVSALVRPLVWLFIFAAGFRQVLGVSIIPPYETFVLYEVYIAPGLIAMIQLFNGMQSSLTMVYDRETGGMRTLLVSPFPRWWMNRKASRQTMPLRQMKYCAREKRCLSVTFWSVI